MLSSSRLTLLSAGALLLATAGMAQATTTIYNDGFTTTGTGTGGNLNGTLTPGTSTTWTAPITSPDVVTGGGYATDTSPSNGGYTNFQATLPLTLAANTVYTLKATLTPNVPNPTKGNWLGLGFGDTTTNGLHDQALVLYRDTGATQFFFGSPDTNGFISVNGSTGATPGQTDTFTITLTTPTSLATGTGAVTYSDSLGLLTGSSTSGTLTNSELNSITGVGLGFYNNTGQATAFSLTSSTVPEPATLGLIGIGGALLLLVPRRKTA